MIRLTVRENEIIEFLEDRPGGRATLDEIADHLYGYGQRPKKWRGSLAQTLRIVTFKTSASRGMTLERVSSVGRGNVGVYALTKEKKSLAS